MWGFSFAEVLLASEEDLCTMELVKHVSSLFVNYVVDFLDFCQFYHVTFCRKYGLSGFKF
jgi:hypothetical protein